MIQSNIYVKYLLRFNLDVLTTYHNFKYNVFLRHSTMYQLKYIICLQGYEKNIQVMYSLYWAPQLLWVIKMPFPHGKLSQTRGSFLKLTSHMPRQEQLNRVTLPSWSMNLQLGNFMIYNYPKNSFYPFYKEPWLLPFGCHWVKWRSFLKWHHCRNDLDHLFVTAIDVTSIINF